MWGGFLPQFLGFEVCQEMKAILTSGDEYAFLDAKAKAALAEWRQDLGELLRRTDGIQTDARAVTWWTFAGGRINQTLEYALEWRARWKVVPDNFALRIEGDGLSHDALLEQLTALRAPEFWPSLDTRQHILALVPEYRLSKFQGALPDRLQVEMVGQYLVDFEATEAFLKATAALPPSGNRTG
jgi:ATP-dependent Lhr-like helicase